MKLTRKMLPPLALVGSIALVPVRALVRRNQGTNKVMAQTLACHRLSLSATTRAGRMMATSMILTTSSSKHMSCNIRCDVLPKYKE